MIDETNMTLGRHWTGQGVRGWYASEKLDGCRVYWDGTTLWTRGGLPVSTPEWMLADLPPGFALDGELWCGRGTLAESVAAVKHGRFPPSARLMVFDAPDAEGDWPARIATARAILADSRTVRVLEYIMLDGLRTLERFFDDVVAAGGEGIMLRDPRAGAYERGRSRRLLKVKISPRLARGRL